MKTIQNKYFAIIIGVAVLLFSYITINYWGVIVSNEYYPSVAQTVSNSTTLTPEEIQKQLNELDSQINQLNQELTNTTNEVNGLESSQKLINQPDGANIIHVATFGSDAGDGSSASPLVSIDKAIAKLDAGGVHDGRIIVHNGTYVLTKSIEIKPASDTSRTLTIEAGQGETPILDGSQALQPQPLSGQSGIYLVNISYSGTNMPQVWHQNQKIRYVPVQSFEVLKGTDYGAYPYSANTIAIHPRGGTLPSSTDLRASLIDYGFIITRSNVKIDRISFTGFGKTNYSAGIVVGANNFSPAVDNITLSNITVNNSYSGILTLKGTSVRKVNISNCDIRDVATGINAHGGDVSITYCKIVNDARASNLFAFKQVDVYMGEAGINVRDSYSISGCEYKYNVIKGFKYGIALQATENQTNGGGYAKYTIEHNTITLSSDDVTSTGSSMGIMFSRYVGSSCASCGPDKALFRYNIIDGFVYPWNVNKSGSAVGTQANIDQNVFWNSSANKTSYEKEFKDIPSDRGIGTNIIGDPMFVSRASQDFRVFSGGSAMNITTSEVPAGALSSVAGGGNVDPNFSLEVPTITNVQKKVGNSYEVIGSTLKVNLTAYDPASVKNTKITISSSATQTVDITHAYTSQESITLPENITTYTITFIIDNGTKSSAPQTITVNKKSSTTSYTDNYVRTSKYGFVVFAKNGQDVEQYISYRKKGDQNWIKGFDDSQYSSATYSDARNAGQKPLIVTGIEANTDYEYMLTTKQNSQSSSIYTINTSGEPKTYYVSTNGEDGFDRGLSVSSAFKTIQFALDLSLPGDTINILPGVYSGTNIMVHSGTSNNHIKIIGNASGGSILNGQNTALSALSLEKVSYIDISDISIQGVATAGILCNKCTSVSIANSFFANQYIGSSLTKTDAAIIVKDSSDINIHHNVIRNWWWGIQVTNSPRTKINNNTIVSIADSSVTLGLGSLDSEITYNSINFPSNTTMVVYVASQDRPRIKIDYNNLASNVSSTYRGDPDTNIDYKPNYPYFKNSRELSWYYESAGSGKVYTSFSKWKNDTGWDTNSIVADPMWADPLKDDFHLRPGSPNILNGNKYIGAMGVGNNIPDIVIENNTGMIYVSNSGSDTSGDGSSAKPYATVQKALDNAEAGDTVFIKAGTYDARRLSIKNSGSAGKPITIEGEKSSSGERLVTFDGGESMTGWVVAPEIGDGVYKFANKVSPVSNSINSLPSTIVIDGKYVDQLKTNGYMDMSVEWKKYMNMDINAEVTADNPEHAQSNQALLGKVKFWDVTKAVFYVTKDYTYLRLADKSNPNNHTVRGAFYVPGSWSYDTLVIKDKNYITIKNINFKTYNNAVSIRGSDSHDIIVTNNKIESLRVGVEVQTGAHDIVISNNDIPLSHFGTVFGAWGISESMTGSQRYEMDLRQAIYQWYHHWIFNSSSFMGISLSAYAGSNIDVGNNKITDGFIAIDVTAEKTSSMNNIRIHDNSISRFSSGAIYARGSLVNLQIYNNVTNDTNYAVRNHELDMDAARKVYIYNNWFVNPLHVGNGIFFHYFSGHPIPTNPPEIYIYHNNFIGGRNGLNFNAYVGEYGGAKGVVVLNNIMSSGDSDLTGAYPPEKDFLGAFDYNWLDNISETYTKRNWFGSNNIKKANGEESIMTINTPVNSKVSSASRAYQAGIDLSKTQNINGRTIGPLPGMSGCSSSKPDMGVIVSCGSGVGDIIPPESTLTAFDSNFTTKKNQVVSGLLSMSGVINSSTRFIITNQTFRGVASVKNDGTFTYSPEQDFVGIDYFNFKVNDGASDSNIATVKIDVRDANNTNQNNIISNGKSYKLSIEPNYSWQNPAIPDSGILTDGKVSSPITLGKGSLAWIDTSYANNPLLEIVVDLGKVYPISEIDMNVIYGRSVIMPSHIFAEISQDNSTYQYVGDLVIGNNNSEPVPARPQPEIKTMFGYTFKKTGVNYKGRYIRLKIDKVGQYFAADEITVFDGNEKDMRDKLISTDNSVVMMGIRSNINNLISGLRNKRGIDASIKSKLDIIEDRALLLSLSKEEKDSFRSFFPHEDSDSAGIKELASIHRDILLQNSKIMQNNGLSDSYIWAYPKWKIFSVTDSPLSSDIGTSLKIFTMNNQRTIQTFMITNATDEQKTYSLSIKGISQIKDSTKLFKIQSIETSDYGFVNDMLVPLQSNSSGFVVDVPAGMTMQILLEFTPTNIPPSELSGSVVLTGSDNSEKKMPITINISNFVFPNNFQLGYNSWEYLSSKYLRPNVYAPTRLKVSENYSRLIDIATTYKIDWLLDAQNLFGVTVDGLGKNNFDNSGKFVPPANYYVDFDNWINQFRNAKKFVIFLGLEATNSNVSKFADADYNSDPALFESRFSAWLDNIEDHVRSMGLKPDQIVIFIADEIQPKDYAKFLPWVKTIADRNVRPGYGSKILSYLDPVLPAPASQISLSDGNIVALTDVLCPSYTSSLQNQSRGENLTFLKMKSETGKISCWYMGYAKNDTYTYPSGVLSGWLAYKYGVSTVFYYKLAGGNGRRNLNFYDTSMADFSTLYFDKFDIYTSKLLESIYISRINYEYLVILDKFKKYIQKNVPSRLDLVNKIDKQINSSLDNTTSAILKNASLRSDYGNTDTVVSDVEANNLWLLINSLSKELNIKNESVLLQSGYDLMAYDYSVKTKQGSSVVGALTVVGAEKNKITYTIINDVKNGTLNINLNGEFKYTPAQNFIGTDYFNFKAHDGSGDSNIATVRITVEGKDNNTGGGGTTTGGGGTTTKTGETTTGGNETTKTSTGGTDIVIPTNNINVYNANYVISRDERLSGIFSINKTPSSNARFLITTKPSKGSVITKNDGTFVYVPESGFVGTDYFQFKVNSNGGDSNIATITIVIKEKNVQNNVIVNNNSNTKVTTVVVPIKTPVSKNNIVYQNPVRTTTTNTNSISFSQKINAILSLGSRGDEVKVLQRVLSKEDLLPNTLNTGYYGTLTQSAVQKLQKKYNIVSSGSPRTTGFGVVGRKTLDLVNTLNAKIPSSSSTVSNGDILVNPNESAKNNTTSPSSAVTNNLKFGSRGDEVKTLQQALVKEKLLAPGLTTGYYGTLTESAVQKLQTKYGIISTGNPQTTGYGSVGPKTKDIINTILKK